jgi:regulator of protease activity HflC (stomatin/prohibitin superfamily)
MNESRHGKNVAIAGAVLQAVFTAVMVGIFLMAKSQAALSCLVFLAGGVGVWLMVALLFYVRQMERREAKELEEITAAAKSGTIFQEEGAQLRPAAARLAWTEKWVVPVFTFLWAGYHAALGVWIVRGALAALSQGWGQPVAETAGAAQAMLFATLIAFVGFLFSRWSLGLAGENAYRPLRAAGSYLFVNVLTIAATAGAMLAAYQSYAQVDLVVAVVVPLVQIALAAELVLSLLLDFYRPRMAEQEERYSFDSRLFNFVAEPGRIGHSIAEAMNYQFGFEVSKTWFYQLLSRAFVPLLLVGAAVMIAMTSVVIVEQGQQVVVMHWGRPDQTRPPLEAGLHFKWPWPVDTVRRFDVAAVHEVILGTGRERTEQERQQAIVQTGTFKGRELYLWTAEHGAREENNFLVAIPPDVYRTAGEDHRPPVSIIKLVVPVQYVITDVYKYGFRVANPEALLEDEAYRQMVRYCASATLDSPVGLQQADRPEAIMTYGSVRAAGELRKRIQAAVDKLDLGVKIVYVGLSAVHPPAEAASAFEEVLKAERQADKTRYEAEAGANETLAQVAGDPMAALKLALAIRALEELEGLSHLRDKPADYQKTLGEDIRLAENDLSSLDEELARDRLLGQQISSKLQLRQDHQEHLLLLRRLEKWTDVDYSALIADARRRADELFDQASGQPAALVAQAVDYRWTRELAEQSRATAFSRELLAYQASPNIYMLDRWLDVWDQVLPGITKYVLGVDREKIEIWLNLERTPGVLEGSLPITPGKK